MIAAAEHGARIVRNFLALARQRPPEREWVALNEVVEQALELVAYQLRVDTVEVRLALAEDLPLLWADPHQLQQVVINLVTNAHQAMRESPPPRRLILTTRSHPGRVLLEIADSGPGIPPALQGRVFEPFFTTKPPGDGTGLGLSLCQGIVEGHWGSIGVSSQPGQGATFRIELPIMEVPATSAAIRAADALPLIRGKAILVVEDEPVVTQLLADLLAVDEHRIERAENGIRALERLRDGSYDLILTDIKMPGLDGPGLYRAVERQDPDLCRRIIFVTGDALSAETWEFLKRPGVTHLTKPFDLEELRRMVQRALRTAPTHRTPGCAERAPH